MANVNIDVGLGTQAKPLEKTAEGPFRIAILGDFSGRANRGVSGAVRAVEIDPEDFEDVMAALNVALDLPSGPVAFRNLDDFHPDQLYQNVKLFETIREAKKQLADPRTFEQPTPPPAPVAPAVSPPAEASFGSLLDQIAERTEPAPAPRVSARDEKSWDQAIRNIASKHAIRANDPRQEQALALLDQTTAAQMRAILSHPDFQAVEAAWRSLFFLFRMVETGVDLHVHLVDVARGELRQKMPELERIFAHRVPGGARWSLLAGLYTFAPNEADCELLARLGALARITGAPFLAAADPRLFGCESIAQAPDPDDWRTRLPDAQQRAWQRLRQSEDASSIGLAFPRFLLRLPYGKETSPIDSFSFEEMPGAPAHDGYLWGNPAIACACLLGREFNRDGWEMRGRSMGRLEGIPLHVSRERETTPQAEIWMTERLAEEIAEAGVMPLASVKHSDEILLVRLQSIADPAQPLAGPW